MNKEILDKLASIITALNSIEVCGKANLMNLGGSIAVIEELYKELTDLYYADAPTQDSTTG